MKVQFGAMVTLPAQSADRLSGAISNPRGLQLYEGSQDVFSYTMPEINQRSGVYKTVATKDDEAMLRGLSKAMQGAPPNTKSELATVAGMFIKARSTSLHN